MAIKESKLLAVQLGTANLNTCSVTVNNVTGDTVSIGYNTLPANQPNTYNNFIAIWESTIIPWEVTPLKKTTIPSNAQNGSVVLDGLTITSSSYIIGYGVSDDLNSIVCSAIMSAGGLSSAPTAVSIGLNAVGTTSISIHYQTLVGYQPKKNKNWLGIWEGYYSPYYSSKPVGKVKIDSNASQGSIGINDITLSTNTEYTLVYFMGKENTTAAAILYFNTSQTESDVTTSKYLMALNSPDIAPSE